MSEDNGFVERPAKSAMMRRTGLMSRLRETAENGKAIRWHHPISGAYSMLLKAEGLRMHQMRQADGTYLAWCERRSEAPQEPTHP